MALDFDTTILDPEYTATPFAIEMSLFHKPDPELSLPIECSHQSGAANYEALQ